MVSNFITRAWKKRKVKTAEMKAGKQAEKQRVRELNEKKEHFRSKVMEIYGWIRLREDMDKFDYRPTFLHKFEEPIEHVNPFHMAYYNPFLMDRATCDESPWSLVELQGEGDTPTGENWATFQ